MWTEWDRQQQASCNVLDNVVPFDSHRAYDMKIIIETIADRNTFYEIMPQYAKNILTGFGEVEGRLIGVVANQP